tara:strand:+ start:3120 stop:3494 length:375 start_codon:yes stop_codon:yes gene_type:complete
MRPKSFRVVGSAGGPTYSPAWAVDTFNVPCNIGIGVTVSGSNTIADVQHTFANPMEINLNVVSAAAWINNSTLVSATAQNNINGSTDTNYAFAPAAIRLRVRAMASAGTGEAATITIIQATMGD